MVKANVTPDAIKKILKQIAKTEKNLYKLNLTLTEVYNILLDVENSLAKTQRIIAKVEMLLKPDATQKQTNKKQINLVATGDKGID